MVRTRNSQLQACLCGVTDLRREPKMTKKKRVAQLEQNVERVFLEFSIVVLVIVLVAMMIGAHYAK